MKTKRISLRLILGSLFTLGLLAPVGAATMSVDITFTALGSGFFRYDLVVTNTGLEDIVLLNIEDVPAIDTRIELTQMAPAGFFINYDPVGFIDIGEETATFTAGNTFSGFSFESSAMPGSAFTNFSALTSGGESVVVTTTLVPEPTSSLLAIIGLFAGCTFRRR